MTQAMEISRPQRQEVDAPSIEGNTITPMTMIDRALMSGAAPETLERLLALQERWEANQGRKAFDEAMAAAKAEIPTIRKNRTVDFTSQKGRTHYKHEDLAEIAETVNPILSKYGLSYRFKTQNAPNEPVSVTCIISHRLGYFEENTLSARPDDSGNKNSIQAVGSTSTYLQRMTLKAALGLAASDDDDAKAAGDPSPISEEQFKRLNELADEVNADKQKLANYLKVGALRDLPASRFNDAIQSLEKKRERVNG